MPPGQHTDDQTSPTHHAQHAVSEQTWALTRPNPGLERFTFMLHSSQLRPYGCRQDRHGVHLPTEGRYMVVEYPLSGTSLGGVCLNFPCPICLIRSRRCLTPATFFFFFGLFRHVVFFFFFPLALSPSSYRPRQSARTSCTTIYSTRRTNGGPCPPSPLCCFCWEINALDPA